QPDGNFFSKLFGYQEKSQPTYDNGEPKTAEELTNGKNPGFTNPEAWVFLNGSYPCPKALAENPVADIKSVAVNSVKR
ncbi:MAG: hypothetical protein LBJ45_02530, partial [Holosporaceae bacterium]|nr:hypothetical protein [Holosporaceae bacterium]